MFLIALVLASGPFLLVMMAATGPGSPGAVDTDALTTLHESATESSALVAAMTVVTFLGSAWCLDIVMSSVVLYLAARRRLWLAAYVGVTALSAWVLNSLVKAWVARPRPVFDDPVAATGGFAFPSGHAMNATVDYAVLLIVLWPFIPPARRRLAIAVYAVLIAAISFSRLVLGLHYLTDVVGGIVLGLAWLCVGTAAFGVWTRREVS